MTSSHPQAILGPILASGPTTLILLSRSELSDSPLLSLLPPLLNPTFRLTHSSSGVLLAELDRLQSAQQFIHELGPDAYTYLLYQTPRSPSEDITSLLATASFQPYNAPSPQMPEGAKSFRPSQPPLAKGTVAWDIKLMAV